MPRGKMLTEREIGLIIGLHGEGKSNREIAASVGRSEKAVRILLSKKDGTKPTEKQMSSRKIAVALDHVVKRTTVLRVLRTSKITSYIERKSPPHLKKTQRPGAWRLRRNI
uniref:AlNc14C56G4242 protein n=1 Tax=Albugo laibachii Nc14 TaxID=890382 RepID=F0WC59_9STRA|nr:AlNc14C56G4242 [Albugo laibachii Nc14]|eukprot:CCA18772.1 AlNc14C56G4242 [Albugo laibachii Nc14]